MALAHQDANLVTVTQKVLSPLSVKRTAVVGVVQVSWELAVTCARRITSTTVRRLAASSALIVTVWSEIR